MIPLYDYKPLIGQALVICGSAISIIGCVANNLYLDHYTAMLIWRWSNIILLAWAVGFCKRWWTNGLGAIALVGMYFVYTLTNEIGLGG